MPTRAPIVFSLVDAVKISLTNVSLASIADDLQLGVVAMNSVIAGSALESV